MLVGIGTRQFVNSTFVYINSAYTGPGGPEAKNNI